MEKSKEMRDCVAFMIVKEGRILAEKRKITAQLDPGAVAVPGGRVEKGESLEAALFREAQEELSITLHNPRFVCTLLEKLTDLYRIHFYAVESWTGRIQCHEAEALIWIPLQEPERLDLEVDRIAVREYRRVYGI